MSQVHSVSWQGGCLSSSLGDLPEGPPLPACWGHTPRGQPRTTEEPWVAEGGVLTKHAHRSDDLATVCYF